MMCGVEESTKQWSCAGRGSAYMSCRIGYIYAAGKVSIGGCRIADTQSCIRCYMHVICRRESVYWWMRIHRGLKKVCITHCERVLESVERAAGGLLVDVAQQVQGEQSVRRQLARRSCCEVWLISQPRFSALI